MAKYVYTLCISVLGGSLSRAAGGVRIPNPRRSYSGFCDSGGGETKKSGWGLMNSVFGGIVVVSAALLSSTVIAYPALAEERAGAWFDLPLPGSATGAEIFQGSNDMPHLRSPYSGTVPEFDGDQAHRWLSSIVDFSYESRESGDSMWGRMTGAPSYNRTIDYIESELKSLGAPVERYQVPFYGPDRLPTDYRAEVVMEDDQGRELDRLPLQSAFPARYSLERDASGAPLLGERSMQTKAEIVPVGAGNLADIATRDLRGKIAFATVPSEPTPFYAGYGSIVGRVREAGAVGLILGWNTPGNMQTALGNCIDMPCMNLGGRDASFLRALIVRSAKSGDRKVMMDMAVDTQAEDGKSTTILTVKIPGEISSNNILLTAHADAYLAGANDNASGVAILMELIRYYSRHRPKYDTYFSISPGHHSDTQGIKPFLSVYPEVPAANLLAINIEHVAQRGVARSQASVLPWGVDMAVPSNYDESALVYKYMNTESSLREIQLSHADNPIVAGIVKDVVTRHRFVAPANPLKSTFQTEIGPVADGGGLTVQLVETSIFYHTAGDTPETVAPETLEAMALFYKDLIDRFSNYTKDEILGQAN